MVFTLIKSLYIYLRENTYFMYHFSDDIVKVFTIFFHRVVPNTPPTIMTYFSIFGQVWLEEGIHFISLFYFSNEHFEL